MDRDEMLQRLVFAVNASERPATTVFAAASVRPHGYPSELPFVPNRNVSLTTIDDTVGLNWFMVPEPDELLEILSELSVQDGWTRKPDAAPREMRFHSLSAHFEKGSAVRG